MLEMATFRIIIVFLKLASVVSLSELMFNVSRDLYEYCPITNFNGRPTNESFILESANEQDPFGRFRTIISCCSSCSPAPDCGDIQLCCPDSEFYMEMRRTCKYPMYIDKPAGSDTSAGTTNHIIAVNEPALFMIQTCAAEFVGTDMEYNCLNARINDVDDPRNVTPVVDTSTYNVYPNIFCANCNGLTDSIDKHFFKALLRCFMTIMRRVIGSSKEERQSFMKDQKCFYHFQPNNASLVSASRCDYYQSQPCQASGAPATAESVTAIDTYNQDACNAYTLPFYTRNIMYKNVHCMLCANEKPRKSDTCYLYSNNANVLSFSFYLILGNSVKAEMRESTNTKYAQCPVAMFYDTYKDECRNVTCSQLKTKTDAGCAEVFSSYAGLYWSISLLWKQIDTDSNTTQTAYLISEAAASTIKNRLPDRYEEPFNLEVFVGHSQDEQLWMYTILIWKAMAGEGIFTVPNMNFIEEHRGHGKTVEISLNNITLCFQASLAKSIYQDNTEERNTIWLYGRELVWTYEESKRGDDSRYIHGAIAVSKTLLCDQVLLAADEYTLFEENVISLITNGNVLSETEYVIDEAGNGTIYVCIDDYLRGSSSSSVTMSTLLEDIAIITSFACSLVSIVCLLVVLLTYASIESLRTVPGKINMGLCSSLLVAQTLQQFAMDQTHVETMCVVFGILIHYFWLNTLFWMNSISFNMLRLFSVIPIQLPFLMEENLVVFYSMYACGSPLIFVLINMLVSLITSNWTDFGYGPAVCYISSSPMVLYTFTLPVIVLVFLNIVCLTLTILGISRVKRPGENNTNNRNDALIFLKLSTLTGVCWVFGFLRLWTGHISFEYMFIFANATQGFFLMVSFVCNRRILGIYQQRFQTTASP